MQTHAMIREKRAMRANMAFKIDPPTCANENVRVSLVPSAE